MPRPATFAREGGLEGQHCQNSTNDDQCRADRRTKGAPPHLAFLRVEFSASLSTVDDRCRRSPPVHCVHKDKNRSDDAEDRTGQSHIATLAKSER